MRGRILGMLFGLGTLGLAGPVDAGPCRATPANLPAGVYAMLLGNGKSLDAWGGGRFENDTPLQGWDYHGGANQRWLITPVGSGRYLVRSAAIAKAVDAYYSCFRTPGCRVSTWRTNRGVTQLWRIERADGAYRLRLDDGGLQLGLTGAIGTNGARAQTGAPGCGAHQLWNLFRLSDYREVSRAEGAGHLMSVSMRLNNFTPRRHEFDGSGERAYFRPNDANVKFRFSGGQVTLPIPLPVLELGPDRMYKTYVNDWNSSGTTITGEAGRLKLTVGFEDAGVEIITNCYNNFHCFIGEPRFDFRNTSMDIFIRPFFDPIRGRFTFNAATRFNTEIAESGPCVNNAWAFLCQMLAPDRESIVRNSVVSTVNNSLADGAARAGLEVVLSTLAGGTSLQSVTVGDDGELIFF